MVDPKKSSEKGHCPGKNKRPSAHKAKRFAKKGGPRKRKNKLKFQGCSRLNRVLLGKNERGNPITRKKREKTEF